MTLAAPPHASRALRILLVEDSDLVRALTSEYLRGYGHDVVDVDSAEDALDIIALSHFNVLFTDLTLPGMSGGDLARKVYAHHPDTFLILSSGFDVLPDMPGLGSVQFLAKPYDLVALDHAFALAAASVARCGSG